LGWHIIGEAVCNRLPIPRSPPPLPMIYWILNLGDAIESLTYVTCEVSFIRMAKLTLSVPEASVTRAKRYARSHKTTVSSLVDRFFATLGKDDQTATPLTDSMVGIAKMPETMDEKELVADAILAKYMK
jgi:hypothetical protein